MHGIKQVTHTLDVFYSVVRVCLLVQFHVLTFNQCRDVNLR